MNNIASIAETFLGKTKEEAGIKKSVEWCAEFVSIVLEKSAIKENIETYEEFAREKLKGMTNTEKEAMFVESDKYWNYSSIPEEVKNITDFAEYVSTMLGGDPSAPTTLEEFREWINQQIPNIQFETDDYLLMYLEYVNP